MADTPSQKALLQGLCYVIGARRAVVLPSKANPKLVVPMCNLRARWRLSAFYPAFKWRAKLWRVLQRFRSCVGFSPTFDTSKNQTVLNFIVDVLPSVTHTSVLLGTPGPNRKIIVQLWQKRELVGYLKVATTPSAGHKIKSEAMVLEQLVPGLGPNLLKCGELDGFAAMILSPVNGEMLTARLPASVDSCEFTVVKEYLAQLRISDQLFAIDEHPAMVRLREQLLNSPEDPSLILDVVKFEEWLVPLRERTWPVVIQHGDFAPWNVLRVAVEERGPRPAISGPRSEEKGQNAENKNQIANRGASSLCAIDWEEGAAEGFPYFDWIHYVSQTAALIEKWSATDCVRYLMGGLKELPVPVRRSVIKLGLLASCLMLKETLNGPHWILDWKAEAGRIADESFADT